MDQADPAALTGNHIQIIPKQLIDTLSSAENVVVLTGSGISAESGVPTFRDAQSGLWAEYDPLDLATPEAFQRNPQLVWQWYEWRRQLINKAKPNPAHTALVHLEQLVSNIYLITQNVDGLHRRAGSHSVIELHGNILQTKCNVEGRMVEKWVDDGRLPPRCPDCDGLLRPDVVWFGEALPYEALTAAIDAASNCDLFFSVGTSSLIQPAATLADYAIQNGAFIVEVNLATTPLTSSANVVLSGPAGQIIPEMVALTFPA